MTEREQKYCERTRHEELQVLSRLVRAPKEAFRAAEWLGLTREFFAEPRHANAFAALMALGPDAGNRLEEALVKHLGDELKTPAARTEFFARAADASTLKADFIAFASHVAVGNALRKIATDFANPDLRVEDLPDAAECVIREMRQRIVGIMSYSGKKSTVPTTLDGTTPTPEHLMNVPGFVNDLAAYTYATAPRPNRVLAFAGALAMLSLLAARMFTDSRGTMTNLYLVALANSGVGKDWPRKVNKNLAIEIEKIGTVAEQLASGEGLEDALYRNPAMLFQIDEFDTFLNPLKESNNISEHLYTYLLSFFSESSTYHTLRKKALSEEAKQAMALDPEGTEKKPHLVIYSPSLSILATAIPSRFYSSLSARALENGFLARHIILEAGLRGAAGKGPFKAPLPQSVVAAAQALAQRAKACAPRVKVPTLYTVPESPGVEEAFERVGAEADALYAAAQSAQDEAAMAVWNRGLEMVHKLALLHALSANVTTPIITTEGIVWGWELVKYSSQRMLAMAAAYVSEDKDDKDCLRIMLFLKKQPNLSAKRSVVSRELHMRCDRMDMAEETLLDQGRITVTTGARNAKIYRAIDTRRKDR